MSPVVSTADRVPGIAPRLGDGDSREAVPAPHTDDRTNEPRRDVAAFELPARNRLL
jgi:hypothetical protein